MGQVVIYALLAGIRVPPPPPPRPGREAEPLVLSAQGAPCQATHWGCDDRTRAARPMLLNVLSFQPPPPPPCQGVFRISKTQGMGDPPKAPPQTKVTIEGRTKFTKGKSGRAVFGTRIFGSQTSSPRPARHSKDALPPVHPQRCEGVSATVLEHLAEEAYIKCQGRYSCDLDYHHHQELLFACRDETTRPASFMHKAPSARVCGGHRTECCTAWEPRGAGQGARAEDIGRPGGWGRRAADRVPRHRQRRSDGCCCPGPRNNARA